MKKTLIIISALTLLILTIFSAQAATFSDVSSSERYKAGIEFLAEQGIVNGYPDGTYKSTQTVNRAEMLKIIAEAYVDFNNLDSSVFDEYKNKDCFLDSVVGEWYNPYVCFAKEKGWVVGYDGGKNFRPSQTVTFVEAAKITFKGFGLDFTEGTIWYKDLVERASEKNYIPFDITGFNQSLQRNQMADMIARILKDEEGKLLVYLGARADVVVTYESIEAGEDLTKLEVEEICAEGAENCEEDDSPQSNGVSMVFMTENGFEPKVLTVSVGTQVQFANSDTVAHYPASAVHPTHKEYPGSDIEKCGTAEESEIFDACGGVEPGQSYEFTFNSKGSWNYHDHFNSSMTGTIVVK